MNLRRYSAAATAITALVCSAAALAGNGQPDSLSNPAAKACFYPATSNPAAATTTMVCRLQVGQVLRFVGSSNGRDGTLTSTISCRHWPAFTLIRHHLGILYAQSIGGGNYIRKTGAPVTAHCSVKLTASLPPATWNIRVKDAATGQSYYRWWITLKRVP